MVSTVNTGPSGFVLMVTFTMPGLPVPLKPTVCVFPVTPPLLSVKVSDPVKAPVVVGSKITDSTQLAPDASGDCVTQLFVVEKLAVAATLVTVKAISPVLVSFTVCAALGTLAACAAKVSEAGVTDPRPTNGCTRTDTEVGALPLYSAAFATARSSLPFP